MKWLGKHVPTVIGVKMLSYSFISCNLTMFSSYHCYYEQIGDKYMSRLDLDKGGAACL
jgi:hypothetical protein